MDSRRIFAIVIIIILLIGTLGTFVTNPTAQQVTGTPIPGTPSIPTVAFPAVPEGGFTVVADSTFFHSSAMFSIPHFSGFDLRTDGEEIREPGPDSKVTRLSVTFTHPQWFAVVHAFIEKNPDNKFTSLKDVDAYYTKEILAGAWQNFTDGWTELNRKTDGDWHIINFEVRLSTQKYLARQLSKLNGEWLMVVRLVAPDNNPQLLDALQQAITPNFQLWPQAGIVPVRWGTISDYAAGYVVRYPPEWKLLDGIAGKPFTVGGPLGANQATLTTSMVAGKVLKSDDDVKKFVAETWPKSVIQTMRPMTAQEASGYAVSYSQPDNDGNQRSAIVALLNGTSDRLYIANVLYSKGGLDLLDPANASVPVEFAQIRNSFFLLPANKLIPTAIPTITPTPAPTSANATPMG